MRAFFVWLYRRQSVNPRRISARIVNDKNMAYQSGFRHCRVTIQNKVVATQFGETTSYQDVCTVWAAKTWKHGAKALQEGALDAYDKVLFRMNWNNIVKRDSLLVCEGKTYQILSLDGEYQKNEIEILAQEVVQGAPAYTPSSSSISGGPRNPQEFGG
jgi:head-tail adaptor